MTNLFLFFGLCLMVIVPVCIFINRDERKRTLPPLTKKELLELSRKGVFDKHDIN
jgi:hypothetical protein